MAYDLKHLGLKELGNKIQQSLKNRVNDSVKVTYWIDDNAIFPTLHNDRLTQAEVNRLKTEGVLPKDAKPKPDDTDLSLSDFFADSFDLLNFLLGLAFRLGTFVDAITDNYRDGQVNFSQVFVDAITDDPNGGVIVHLAIPAE